MAAKGDECLIEIGKILLKFVNRPGDICARYGGDEFVVVWSDTTSNQSAELSRKILDEIVALNIPNERSLASSYLTASIGLATVTPNKDSKASELICTADNMLYQAKGKGRNRVEF